MQDINIKIQTMIKRLLSFLDASPVNFLAVKNISEELEKNGFRRMNPQEPFGQD